MAAVGVPADACLESTGRFAVELGYLRHAGPRRDCGPHPQSMHAALELNGPTYAHVIVTTDLLVTAFKEEQS